MGPMDLLGYDMGAPGGAQQTPSWMQNLQPLLAAYQTGGSAGVIDRLTGGNGVNTPAPSVAQNAPPRMMPVQAPQGSAMQPVMLQDGQLPQPQMQQLQPPALPQKGGGGGGNQQAAGMISKWMGGGGAEAGAAGGAAGGGASGAAGALEL